MLNDRMCRAFKWRLVRTMKITEDAEPISESVPASLVPMDM